MGTFTGVTEKTIDVPLKMNIMSKNDDIFNPFTMFYDSNEHYYISTILDLAEE